ncbi:hypothetical protein F3Y22_tig00111213pilonHSYRG00346 [Hibiscus syriacus]|uniref:Uncharacterized protein n=1 Tax=Hibiscus syriacus TaxID=106335 RepID=A0A6A2YUX1_HIBSY|nr:hypothetical protein F3Y22_tig00111213pilonHSYRG00346 [Hibiscus syriacus]
MIDATKSRILEIVESTLPLSNLDIVASVLLKGVSSTSSLPATSRVQNDILGPVLTDARNLLGDYAAWLQSNNARERNIYKESFEKRWPSVTFSDKHYALETNKLLRKIDRFSLRVIENFSANAASKLFECEICGAFLGTFGGLGAASFSSSLLTSILPTTLEERVVEFALNSPRLRSLTSKLKEVRMTWSLFDTTCWAQNLEKAYFTMIIEGMIGYVHLPTIILKPKENMNQMLKA